MWVMSVVRFPKYQTCTLASETSYLTASPHCFEEIREHRDSQSFTQLEAAEQGKPSSCRRQQHTNDHLWTWINCLRTKWFASSYFIKIKVEVFQKCFRCHCFLTTFPLLDRSTVTINSLTNFCWVWGPETQLAKNLLRSWFQWLWFGSNRRYSRMSTMRTTSKPEVPTKTRLSYKVCKIDPVRLTKVRERCIMNSAGFLSFLIDDSWSY